MASSADVKLDRNTPEDQWKQVLSTEEVHPHACVEAFSDQLHIQHLHVLMHVGRKMPFQTLLRSVPPLHL